MSPRRSTAIVALHITRIESELTALVLLTDNGYLWIWGGRLLYKASYY